MNLSFSRLAVIAPAIVLVFIGAASLAFSWGANSAGHPPSPPGPAMASPAATGRGIPPVGLGGPGAVIGTVASKTASAIVVTTFAGQAVTVNVTSATTYSVRGIAAATLDNIAVGTRIVVQGTPNADGSVNATLVQSGIGGRGFGDGGRSRGGFGLPTPSPTAAASGPST